VIDFTLRGAPIIYCGDEIGMGDNIWLPDRNGLRTPMQWDASTSAGFSDTTNLYSPVIDRPPYNYQFVNVAAQKIESSSLWYATRRMIQLRKEHSVLADGELNWVGGGSDAILAYDRSSLSEHILVIQNLSSTAQDVTLQLESNQLTWTDLFTNQLFVGWVEGGAFSRETQVQKRYLRLNLAPYQYLWLK
jgi:maltose alpha-D-glucosyltransferase/alpha-amylase